MKLMHVCITTNQIRTSGVQTSNEEILKFSKLFEDDITLDNLNHAQLRAMCQMLEITPVGPSYILRFQLEMKLRELQADDKVGLLIDYDWLNVIMNAMDIIILVQYYMIMFYIYILG